MSTIHENLVPTIPSGTLPQTPAADWADNVQDSLGAHVTRTPVGTPGPKVPGGWNDEVEPARGNAQDLRAYLPAQEDVQRALDGAKAYLPQSVAEYYYGMSLYPSVNTDHARRRLSSNQPSDDSG